jgi:two-component system cell cycle sensor histidine kinase/response regulator CckA
VSAGSGLTLVGRAESAPARRVVLVADDYPSVLAWAARAFGRAGWSVVTATEGTQALGAWEEARARGAPVTLLVTDLGLPGLDGATLARALRARDPALPVVAISGHADGEAAWSGPLLDRTAFFRKPVGADELLKAADALAHRDAAGDEPCPVEPVA